MLQPGGTSWHPDRSDICDLLLRSRHVETRNIYYGSNACFLLVLEDESAGRSLAVYKPARGEYPLWDFPQGTLYRREVATFRLDDLLGWKLIPPTVVGRGKFGPGSIQIFIEEAQGAADIQVLALRRMALLDWIVNNADRKPDHVLVTETGHLWGIDHGLTFHVQPKLRTILWHFAGEPLEAEEIADLERLKGLLREPEGNTVHELLDPLESQALLRRLDALTLGGRFPDPLHKAVPYRW